MAKIPKGRLVKGPYKARCRDCAMYFQLLYVPQFLSRTPQRALQDADAEGDFAKSATCAKRARQIFNEAALKIGRVRLK